MGHYTSIAVDGSDNSYVSGSFSGSATFGLGETNETTLNGGPGFTDIFVAKYDANGMLVWAKSAGGLDSDRSFGLAVDGAGNSYLTGDFGNSATFGLGEANETTLTSDGLTDIFIAQYDANGELVWAIRAGGTDSEQGNAIALDGAGNSYITGIFLGSPTFGPGEANETALTSDGGNDIFIAKYETTGELAWAKRAGGTSTDMGLGIAANSAGNSYLSGSFRATATFAPGETNETLLTSAGSHEIFVAKYEANGDLQWAKRAGGVGFERAADIALDGSGNCHITGDFEGSATFGPSEANQTILTSDASSDDIFVAKYNPVDGTLLWARRAGGSANDQGLNLAVDGAGNTCVTGRFQATATFGLGETNETSLTSDASSADIFVAKYQDVVECTPPVITTAAPTNLWPPNHKYETITVAQCVVSVQDGCGGSIPVSNVIVTKVTSDEPEDANGGGDGNTINDMVIAGDCKSVQLRRERQGSGNGRVYTIHLSVKDGSDNVGTETCQVTVPHDQSGALAVDDGPANTVNGACAGGSLTLAGVSSADDGSIAATLPEDYTLEQNYPNPFNPSTTIHFALPEAGSVTMQVYTLTGQLVRQLASGQYASGRHEVVWDGKDGSGAAVASGIYFYRLDVQKLNGEAAYSETRKMALVK